MEQRPDIKLTQFSHGAGCGCKIAPGVLDTILKSSPSGMYPNLLVGFEQRDDAAVLELENGSCLISTTDFFMPIVDDAYDFGRIASVNAISDVYAMGGNPLLALGILGWPIDKIDPYWASVVLEGAKAVCAEAGIPLAGGHSIDSPEPIFGLAVNGIVQKDHLKTNGAALAGDVLFLTKPLGVGLLTTAEKKGLLASAHRSIVLQNMLKLNKVGAELAENPKVHAMTDVTGFGLGGHLIELCEASGVVAEINYVKLPRLVPDLDDYVGKQCIPGGTHRNWKSYGHKISLRNETWKYVVGDPQTSGGLLIAVDPTVQDSIAEQLAAGGWNSKPIGVLKPQNLQSIGEGIRVSIL